MHSIAGAFPDARVLLSLDPDQLAGLFLFFFRNLPWRDQRAVRRCVIHWTRPYPVELQPELVQALMAAWRLLDAEQLLDVRHTATGTTQRAKAAERGIRLRA